MDFVPSSLMDGLIVQIQSLFTMPFIQLLLEKGIISVR